MTPTSNTFMVESSHGSWEVNCSTGLPVTALDYDGVNIRRFDVMEFGAKYPNPMGYKVCPCISIDILDIGYWYDHMDSVEYEPPAEDWRNEKVRLQHADEP